MAVQERLRAERREADDAAAALRVEVKELVVRLGRAQVANQALLADQAAREAHLREVEESSQVRRVLGGAVWGIRGLVVRESKTLNPKPEP